jgi:catechol 2,3-dioxygenase-like lactoylglutathione lyase family enzyme
MNGTTPHFAFALEYVDDIEAAKRFYVEVLGLQVEREAPVFVQFQDSAGIRYAIASDESLSGSRGLELYWLVDDAEAACSLLSQRAELCIPLRQMAFGKVFAVKDPAGQPQFFVEFAQSRPSHTVTL